MTSSCRWPANSRPPTRWSPPVFAIGLGEDAAEVFAALDSLKGAPGRMEKVAYAAIGAPIYVDYAHTPGFAGKGAGGACARIPRASLHVVFGCGGDRDKGKRPLMGAIAGEAGRRRDRHRRQSAHRRCRHHPPRDSGGGPGAQEIGDRAAAIRAAIAAMAQGDVLVMAGKGHETGQSWATRSILSPTATKP